MSRAWIGAAALVTLVSVAINAPTLSYDFVYDDRAVILDREPVWESSPSQFIQTRPWGLTRHLTLASLDLDRREPLSARTFHLTNLLLTTLIALLVAGLARHLGAGPLGTAVSGVVSAVHPTHADAVASIVGRAELLATLFVLIALLSDLRACDSGRRRHPLHLALLGACLLGGMFSKENAIILPALVILGRVCLRPLKGLRPQLTDIAVATVPFAAAMLVWLWVALPLLPDVSPVAYVDNPLAHGTTLERLLGATEILWRYAWLVVVPWPLAPDRSFAATSPSFFVGVTSLAAWLTATLILATRMARHPRLSWSLLWFPLAFVPTANLFFATGTIMAERLMLLPSIGPIVGIGLLARKAQTKFGMLPTIAVSMALVGLLAAAYSVRVEVWRNSTSFHQAAIQASPRSAKAHYDAGLFHQRNNSWDLAAAEFKEALKIYPAFQSAVRELAEGMARERDPFAGLGIYEDYLKHTPNDVTVLANAIRLGITSGKPKRVVPLAEHLLALDPSDPDSSKMLDAVTAMVDRARTRRHQSLNANSESGSR
ncbi:MAG: hypothetical protein ACI8TX_003637 [Hyphomicrobiaceae bacterium]|jgi:hypothetical protein